MNVLFLVVAILLAYLLGSIPSAVWYGQIFFNLDIRQYGSGNAGATNTFRVLGKRAGTVVMLADVLKGYAATMIAPVLASMGIIAPGEVLTWKLVFGVVAVLGHLYPVLAQFRGGKGVATLLGMILSIHPEMALICIGIWLLVVIASHYVSLGSILAALAFPVLLVLRIFGHPESPVLIVFGFAMFLIVAFTHQKNIGRLWRGEENRTMLFQSRKKRNE